MTDINHRKNGQFGWILWLVVILWVMVIFYLSSQTKLESKQLSINLTEKIMELVDVLIPQMDISVRSLHSILRPSAHFFSFMMLSVLVMYALRRNGTRGKRGVLLAFGICAVIAMMDETFQYFVPGRDARISDVILDSVGAAVGIILYALVSAVYRNLKAPE